METLKTLNYIIAVIFFVCYTSQFLYIPVPYLRKEKPHGPAKANRYAVLICARNEQRVIGDLIASLRGQTYDQSLLSIFVLADNCTDDTAMVARVAGAHVYERFNQVRVGKGYALQSCWSIWSRIIPGALTDTSCLTRTIFWLPTMWRL